MKKLLFKISLFAFSLFVISCTKTELEDIDELKISNDEQTIPNDDISYFGSDTLLASYINDIANKIRTFKKSNPNASDRDIDLYADKIVKNYTLSEKHLNSRAYSDMDGYLTSSLNPQEKALYNSNKAKALLCMANGQLAIKYAESNYIGSVLLNGNGDAFRHTLWNFGMTLDVGSTFAKAFSDAHEYGATNPKPLEKSMDLYNNGIGIQLGKDYPNTILHSTFISRTKEKVKGGKCYIISSNKLVWSNSNGEK